MGERQCSWSDLNLIQGVVEISKKNNYWKTITEKTITKDNKNPDLLHIFHQYLQCITHLWSLITITDELLHLEASSLTKQITDSNLGDRAFLFL